MDPMIKQLEINVDKSNINPDYLCDFLIRHRILAVVLPSELVKPMIVRRMAKRGQFKIIVSVDFPRGENFVMNKIHRNKLDLDGVDGVDILLSSGKTEIETHNELKTLYEFFKLFNPTLEIRWCLGAYTKSLDDVEKLLKSMSKYPPSFVRLDQHLDVPNLTPDKVVELSKLVKTYLPHPLKASGNFKLDDLKALSNHIKRFDVSLDQAQKLVNSSNKPENTKIEVGQ